MSDDIRLLAFHCKTGGFVLGKCDESFFRRNESPDDGLAEIIFNGPTRKKKKRNLYIQYFRHIHLRKCIKYGYKYNPAFFVFLTALDNWSFHFSDSALPPFLLSFLVDILYN